jgi:hypothetical protein
VARSSQESAHSGCTGLSGGAPDCPVVHRTASGAPGWHPSTSCSRDFVGGVRLKFTGLSGGAPDCPVSQRSARPTVGRGIRARRVASANGRMGHRTVRCAPDSVRCANGSKTATVGFAKRKEICTGLSGAPGDRRQDLPSWNALNGS